MNAVIVVVADIIARNGIVAGIMEIDAVVVVAGSIACNGVIV